MAFELKTIFTVQDRATAPIKRLIRQMEQLNRGMNQLNTASSRMATELNRASNSMNRQRTQVSSVTQTIIHNTTVVNNNSNTVNKNTNTINRNSNARNTMINVIGREASALRGLGASLVSVAGLYAAAHGASKAFDATIGAAARYQQAEVTVKAIFNDDKASKAYLAMVDKMAIDSPLLNSGEMLKSSKGLVAMTKNVGELGKAWSIIERLMVLDPTQGTDGAAFALKEMWQGDALSMVERFGLNKSDMNRIKKLGIAEQITEINKVLTKMGITQDVLENMGSTTLGYWSQIQERADKFSRILGEDSNSKINQLLRDFVAYTDSLNMESVAKRMGDALGNVVQKAIDVGKKLWQWREPLAYMTGAIAVAGTAFVGVGVIAALANPISLIAAGIAGASVGMVALYNNSETFRGAIDGIIGKAKELWAVFKEGGIGGVMSEILPPNISETIQRVIASVGQLWGAFKSGGVSGLLEAILPDGMLTALQERFTTIKDQFTNTFTSIYNAVVPILQTAWSLVSPILSALWTALKIVADVAMLAWNNILAPAIQFVSAAVQTMWKITGPIFELLGAVIQTAFSVLKVVWDSIVGPFVAFLAGAFTTGFGMATEVVKALSPVFEKLGGMISTAADYLKSFADWLGKIKVPDWIGKIGSGAVNMAKKLIPGHYHGLTNVPYDNYVARLHKGETVLPRQEAALYRSIVSPGDSLSSMFTGTQSDMSSALSDISYERAAASITYNNTSTKNTYNTSTGNQGDKQPTQSQRSISIAKLADQIVVREDADIEKIAFDLAKYIEKEVGFVG
ncbi:phage tail protein [Lysinibacillus odysseyi]|uniref:phage tail protein n=1 Tax=Lysinibacillus odysseyi TaxID=202611 RepID=UPI00068DAA7A|nr:hypothetical protein [Lysinibacillus odysseyi]